MRQVLALLVAANVVFLGWNAFQRFAADDAPVVVDEGADEDAPRIELLAEVDARELRERVQAAPEPASVIVSAGPAGEAPAAPESRIESDPIAPDAGDPEGEADSEDAAIATVEGPALPDPAPIEEVLAAVLPTPTVPDVGDRLCYSVGPLTTPEEVAAMGRWLDARGGEAALREDERRELALYWVFFPPLAGREQALERVEQLRGQGIGDIYIIPRGDMANAISLGVYSRRDSLERRLRQLRAKGHEPSITPRYKTKKASWYDVAFDESFDFRASGFAESFPAVEMSPGPCATLPATSASGLAEGGLAGSDADDAEDGARIAADRDEPYDPDPARRGYLFSGQTPVAPPQPQ